MELLKVCTGECRADYVLRGTTCRNEALKLAHACRDDMKTTLAKVLGVDVIQDDTWAQATLPVKMGGLGIRDPTQIWPAFLLANTSSVESTAVLLGGEAEFLRTMQNIAITLYCQAVGCLPSALTIPQVD